MGESSARFRAASNLRGGKSVTKNNSPARGRNLFRDLARLAAPRKTEHFLAERTGSNPRTAKRWLSGKGRAPDKAVYVVFGQLMEELRQQS